MTREAIRYLQLTAAVLLLALGVLLAPPWEAPFAFEPASRRPAVGWAAVLFGTVSAAYFIRKRELLQIPGGLFVWKGGHVATGSAFLLLWLFHAHGRLIAGDQLVMAVCILGVMGTGIWGIVAQGAIPKVMNETLMDPVYKDELKDDVAGLLAGIDEKLAGTSRELHRAYQRHVLPTLAIARPAEHDQRDLLRRCFGGANAGPNVAVHDVGALSAAERGIFFEIAEKALDVVEVRRSQAYQQRMNGWLAWHTGFSFALGGTLLFHVLTASYF